MDFLSKFGLLRATDTRVLAQPSSTQGLAADETLPDADDEPDERHLALKRGPSQEFKKMPCPMARKQSLLTQTLHTSESDTHIDDEYSEPLFSGSNRAHSTTSTGSRGSEAGHISDAYPSSVQSATPSPILRPASLLGLAPLFSHKPFEMRPSTKTAASDSIEPLRSAPLAAQNEEAVEKELGRKRCIMFACKPTSEDTNDGTPKQEATLPATEAALPVKRPCMLTFVCPSKSDPTPTDKSRPRLPSPAPPPRVMLRSPKSTRPHRGSDATVRNESPKSVRKVPTAFRHRRSSSATGVPICEATRFHEFASSEEECEDWTVEKCTYRNRLTVEDTLKVENSLRKLGEEAEDEEREEEEAEEQLANMNGDEDDVDEDEDDDDDDDDDDNQSLVDSTGYVTDDGFHTDDEDGFADSDDESDQGSDYRWWAPSNGTQDAVEHIRPLGEVIGSPSSIGSFSSTRVFPSKTPRALRRSKINPIDVRPRSPELPDSTDFVCGTLDEDKPLEDAWRTCREQRRAAKHKVCAQDFDPTFPASDPDMDEEDEVEEYDLPHMDVDDSDRQFLIHGHPAALCDEDEEEDRQPYRVVPRKRSPAHSPKRLRSPPPAAKLRVHSPPPRRLFSGHSPKRMHSPAPRRLRSPPPTRRPSLLHADTADGTATPMALAQRPHDDRTASSVPRNGPYMPRNNYFGTSDDSNDGEETQTDLRPTRGAIDIVKGLEKKRQRRREKLFEKHCRQKAKSKKHAHDDVVLPGIGAQKMKRMGEGLVKLRGHGVRKTERGLPLCFETDTLGEGQHILSY